MVNGPMIPQNKQLRVSILVFSFYFFSCLMTCATNVVPPLQLGSSFPGCVGAHVSRFQLRSYVPAVVSHLLSQMAAFAGADFHKEPINHY
jgi:hypothetical protein